jgi:hypothetical protein
MKELTMDKFLKVLKENNDVKNIDFQVDKHFLVPYLEKENKEYEIKLSFPFILPLEAIEFDENHHYILTTFVKDNSLRDALNGYLNWLFRDIDKFKELFDEFSELNESLKKRIKSCGVDFDYMNEFYKITTIKEKMLLSKSIEIDNKYYFVFIDFIKNGNFEIKNNEFILKGKGIQKRLFNYFEKIDIFDFLNDYFLMSDLNYAYSIRGIKINKFLVGRRKEIKIENNKFIPIIEDNFYKRVLIGSNISYLAYNSFKEVNDSIEDFSKLKSANLEFLLNLYEDIEKLKDLKLKKLLKDAIMLQLKLIGKGIITDE